MFPLRHTDGSTVRVGFTANYNDNSDFPFGWYVDLRDGEILAADRGENAVAPEQGQEKKNLSVLCTVVETIPRCC